MNATPGSYSIAFIGLKDAVIWHSFALAISWDFPNFLRPRQESTLQAWHDLGFITYAHIRWIARR